MRNKTVRGSSVMAVVFTAMMVWGSPAWAETFTVTNTDDSGSGSLREAVEKANDEANNPGEDFIDFDPSLTA